ncbi:alpha/beta hydrolase [Bacteroidales bacterium AH-315-I05]|nr:alpha/beta hydrolase [Bacteroidales bacterium AH-315-I05]
MPTFGLPTDEGMLEENIIKEGRYEYIEEGEGPVILVLHGLFGALSNFKDVLEHFSQKFKVVIPILPIYKLPLRKTGVKALGNFVNDFVNFRQYEKVNVLGNSLGGHLALVYAAAHIEKINSMILTGSSGLYENAFGGSFPRREDKEYLRKKIEVTFYDPVMATDELVDECYEAVNNREKVIRILAIAKSAIRHNMADELPEMNIPTCLIWGKNDNITPPHVAELFKKLLPEADLFWVDKCGHAPMMERPREFNELMDGWLGKIYS